MFLEKKTFKFRQYIFTLLLSPLRKERGPSFEQTWIPFALYYVWLKLAKWFWRRRYLNLIYILSLFFFYLLLEKDMVLHLDKLEFPSHKNSLYQVWVKMAKWFWRRRRKCEKFTTKTTTPTMDNEQIVIRKAKLSLSLRLRWAENDYGDTCFSCFTLITSLV